MRTKLIILSVVVLLGLCSLGQQRPEDKKEISAYIVKVIRDVNMKSPASGWQKAVPLSKLKSGYEVQTDKNSLAMILFADQSKLILREKSVVTIKGEVQGKQILSRSVHIDQGTMIFNVKKAETEQFRFSSPISVASIRGTQGGYVAGAGADSLTIAEGLADFTNSVSGKTGSVGSGQTGVADSSGKFDIHRADRNSLDAIINGQNAGEENVGAPDTNQTGASFGHLQSKHSGSVHVDLTAFQGKATGASLFCRKVGEQNFTEIALVVSGQTAAGQIPADRVQDPKLEYYLSIKLQDGTTALLPQNGSSQPAFAAVAPFTHELRIPGQTGSLQKKVIVLKWNE